MTVHRKHATEEIARIAAYQGQYGVVLPMAATANLLP